MCNDVTKLFYYGRHDEMEKAKELADSMPWMAISRECLLWNFTKGNEKLTNLHLMLDSAVGVIINGLQHLNCKLDDGTMAYTEEEMVQVREKAIQLIKLLYEDGNYGFYFLRLDELHTAQADYYAKQQDRDNTLYHAKKATQYAISFDQGAMDGTFTSLLFRGGSKGNFGTTNSQNRASVLFNHLQASEYDFIRNHDEFEEAVQKLSANADHWKVE